MNPYVKKISLFVMIVLVFALAGWALWQQQAKDDMAGLISGNGRLEATEIDIATKMPGRIMDINVREGDFVEAGQVLAQMQVDSLNALLREVSAQQQQAVNAVATAEAQVKMRESARLAALAVVAQRQSDLDNIKRRLARTETLSKEGAASVQQLDDERAALASLKAALAAAKAQVSNSDAAIVAAQSQVIGAQSTVESLEASLARIQVDIDDSQLKAPRNGRVQYRIAQPGEVLPGGGKLLNMVDLSDVYITFFLPETVVGKVALGSEVHIILDAAPQYVIPAQVSFVSSVAQFTPKTVETTLERQKLMFKVKARIDEDLLKQHLKQVKTGLPGVAWLKLDSQAIWPEHLAVKVPE